MSIYVGMDVHRKRSQIAIVDEAGVQQRNRNVPNDPAKLIPILGALPPGTPVAFEAAHGWGWLVELLEELELEPHLVHPSRCKAIAAARLKNDKVDAATLAQLLRADLLPEAWIAPSGSATCALLRHRPWPCWTVSPNRSPAWSARSMRSPGPTQGLGAHGPARGLAS